LISSIRCRSSTGLVPENSSSFLTPSATVALPFYWRMILIGKPVPTFPGSCARERPGQLPF
jgi:hypothetical protein